MLSVTMLKLQKMDLLIIFQSQPLTDRPHTLIAQDVIIINKQTCARMVVVNKVHKQGDAAPCTVPHNHASLHK